MHAHASARLLAPHAHGALTVKFYALWAHYNKNFEPAMTNNHTAKKSIIILNSYS